ncbi:MAG: hypothetical protein O2909_02680 [Chloroflexi bacterium]|nr:hypothetical protein [Chloroflexota bacterium]MDA1218329.1 hypothetical protein [Chloroflexota bacterium]
MGVSAYLLPFPDPGAFDLMSDHLEQGLQTTGPGKVLIKVSLPGALFEGSGPGDSLAKKRLELFRREGENWTLLWGATTASDQARQEMSWDIASAETLKCRLTNMTGREGQFSLECTFIPLAGD